MAKTGGKWKKAANKRKHARQRQARHEREMHYMMLDSEPRPNLTGLFGKSWRHAKVFMEWARDKLRTN